MSSHLKTPEQPPQQFEPASFDGDSAAFLTSVVIHVGVLLALGLWPLVFQSNHVELTLETLLEEETMMELKNHLHYLQRNLHLLSNR